MLKKSKHWEFTYLVCYALVLLFFMRFDFLYNPNLGEVLLKRMPYQLLCLAMGMGLAYTVNLAITREGNKKSWLVSLGYFAVLYGVLMNTGVLWINYTNLQDIAMIAIILVLVRIIEKHKIGAFWEGNKQRLYKIVYLVLAFFLVIDLAYKPSYEEKESIVNSFTNVDARTVFDSSVTRLENLNSSKWAKLSVEEKLDLLQTVVNIELNHLGLNNELKVKCRGLGTGVNACYNEQEHIIYINEKRLEYSNAKEMLNSAAHETFHAYQKELVDTYRLADEKQKRLYHFRKLAQYQKEMNSYNNGKSDYGKYFDQELERDARYYGMERAHYYQEKLKLK